MGKGVELRLDTKKLKQNISALLCACEKQNVQIAGVIKGLNGLPQVADLYVDAGIGILALSRVEQIAMCRSNGIVCTYMLTRVPSISEAAEVAALCDISLNSDKQVLAALNQAASHCSKKHSVILMLDMGDCREGVQREEDLIELAHYVENHLEHLMLVGIGANFSCHRKMLPKSEQLDRVVHHTKQVEQNIGRTLEFISVGGTSCLPLLYDGTLPPRVNLLRVGEAIHMNHDLKRIFGYRAEQLETDCVHLTAEIVDLKHKEQCSAHGIKRWKQILVNVGSTDFGDAANIQPQDPDLRIVQVTSDLTAIEVAEEKTLQVGDSVDFNLNYDAVARLTSGRTVQMI